MNAKRIVLAAAMFVLFGGCAFAQSATDTLHRDELGVTRLQVIYPEANSMIDEKTPMISADATRLETPIDPQTVDITLNGASVTELSEITTGYVLYQPTDPLPPGEYEVRITAKDMNRKNIEPLSWTFRIKGMAKAAAPGTKPAAPADQGNTVGRLAISMDISDAGFAMTVPGVGQDQILREKNGHKVNADLNFTSTNPGRTILGAYHRETQYYTGTVLDKGRINYFAPNLTVALGDSWMALSDLTVTGTELDGLKVDTKRGRWRLTGFSGRTQDPSTSGTYKQLTNGVSGEFEWRPGSRTTITTLTSNESGIDRPGERPPARIRLTTLRQELGVGENFTTSFETGWNSYLERQGTRAHDRAYRLAFNGRTGRLSGEAEMYRYGEDYFPISEGSSKFLKNDRAGSRIKAMWKPHKIASFGGEYEDYYTLSQPSYTTKRWNAFAAVSRGRLQSLTWRLGRLGANGSVSKTDSINTIIVLPGTRIFTETRITAGWQKVDYDTATGAIRLFSGTTIRMLGLNSAYKDILGFSVNYTNSNSGNIDFVGGGGTTSRSKDFTAAANWNIVPFKFMWNLIYDRRNNSGTNTSNFERTWKTSFKYVVNKTYSFDLGYDHVRHVDDVSPIYDYRQNIFRIGGDWSF